MEHFKSNGRPFFRYLRLKFMESKYNSCESPVLNCVIEAAKYFERQGKYFKK